MNEWMVREAYSITTFGFVTLYLFKLKPAMTAFIEIQTF